MLADPRSAAIRAAGRRAAVLRHVVHSEALHVHPARLGLPEGGRLPLLHLPEAHLILLRFLHRSSGLFIW